MLTSSHVTAAIDSLRALLECEKVCLVLTCAEQELRHPLLELIETPFMSAEGLAVACGATELAELLADEEVQAYSDLALLSGQMQQCIPRLSGAHAALRSLLIAPLETSVGVLGVLLLASTQAEAFGAGEIALLSASLSGIACACEMELRTHVGCMLRQTSQICARDVVLHEAEDELAEREEPFKREIVSVVSHELRTPLSVIKGYAGLLQAYGVSDQIASAVEMRGLRLSPARQQQYLNEIMQQIDHLEVLVNDLLDVSRVQTGRLALRFTGIDLGMLCQRVVVVMRSVAEQRYGGQYRILCKVQAGLPPVWADPDRVEQILHNVIENAIKYSPEGGIIKLCAGLVGDGTSRTSRVEVVVYDQGIGIAQAGQPYIDLFKPYTRLHHPEAKHVEGVGLGLYVSRKLIEAMGGSIAISARNGCGTAVSLTFPLAMQNPCVKQGSLI